MALASQHRRGSQCQNRWQRMAFAAAASILYIINVFCYRVRRVNLAGMQPLAASCVSGLGGFAPVKEPFASVERAIREQHAFQ
jgi:hypothetical protein